MGAWDRALSTDRRSDIHDPGTRRQSRVEPYRRAWYPRRRRRQQGNGRPVRSSEAATTLLRQATETRRHCDSLWPVTADTVMNSGLGLWALGFGLWDLRHACGVQKLRRLPPPADRETRRRQRPAA